MAGKKKRKSPLKKDFFFKKSIDRKSIIVYNKDS